MISAIFYNSKPEIVEKFFDRLRKKKNWAVSNWDTYQRIRIKNKDFQDIIIFERRNDKIYSISDIMIPVFFSLGELYEKYYFSKQKNTDVKKIIKIYENQIKFQQKNIQRLQNKLIKISKINAKNTKKADIISNFSNIIKNNKENITKINKKIKYFKLELK